MEYRKPTLTASVLAIRAIEGNNFAGKGWFFVDGQFNPNGKGSLGFRNNVTPAYEADE